MLDDFSLGDKVSLGGLRGRIVEVGWSKVERYHDYNGMPHYMSHTESIWVEFDLDCGSLKLDERSIKYLKRESNETI